MLLSSLLYIPPAAFARGEQELALSESRSSVAKACFGDVTNSLIAARALISSA
jgi:hypothetical protein